MSDVVPLHEGITISGESVEGVVDLLELWLGKAKSGEIVSVSLACVHPNHDVQWAHAGGCVFSMIGALEALKVDLLRLDTPPASSESA
jgi:hypothetical protein